MWDFFFRRIRDWRLFLMVRRNTSPSTRCPKSRETISRCPRSKETISRCPRSRETISRCPRSRETISRGPRNRETISGCPSVPRIRVPSLGVPWVGKPLGDLLLKFVLHFYIIRLHTSYSVQWRVLSTLVLRVFDS